MVVIGVLILVVLAYFCGYKDARMLYEEPEITRLEGARVLHADGRNCPPFVVLKEHHYPVMWCPFCGAECRHTGEVTQEASG